MLDFFFGRYDTWRVIGVQYWIGLSVWYLVLELEKINNEGLWDLKQISVPCVYWTQKPNPRGATASIHLLAIKTGFKYISP